MAKSKEQQTADIIVIVSPLLKWMHGLYKQNRSSKFSLLKNSVEVQTAYYLLRILHMHIIYFDKMYPFLSSPISSPTLPFHI